MKNCIVIFAGFFAFALSVSGQSQRVLICQVEGTNKCVFKAKSLYLNETASIIADHTIQSRDYDITTVQFLTSQISYIPSGLFSIFENLERLELIGQNVEAIFPDTFINATKLKVLLIPNNKLTTLEADMFAGADNLEQLQLFGNQITQVNVSTFRNLQNLQILDIYNNKIQSVHQNIFRPLISLTTLHFCCNELDYLHQTLFAANLKLEKLYLHSNKLNSLSNRMFRHLENLTVLHLGSNFCISKEYTNAKAQMPTIENDLRMCSISYVHQENAQLNTQINKLNEKVDDNFEFLHKRIISIERLLQMISFKIDRK